MKKFPIKQYEKAISKFDRPTLIKALARESEMRFYYACFLSDLREGMDKIYKRIAHE